MEETKKKSGISTYLPAFGVKGWAVAILGIAFYYFYQGPLVGGTGFTFTYFEEMYGWTNLQVSMSLTVGSIIGVISILFWGPFNKKFGTKNMCFTGLIGVAIALVLLAFFPSLPMLYFATSLYVFCAIAFSQLGVAQFAANWFPRTKGMYMGMATMGLTLGGATLVLIPTLLSPIIGFPNVLLGFAAGAVIVAVLMMIFIKNTPEEAGAWPDNDRTVSREELDKEFQAAQEYKKRSPWNLRKTLHCKYTWTIAIGWGILMMCSGGYLAQLVPMLISFGHSPTLGVVLLSSLWPAGVIGNYLGGVVDNRFGTKVASLIVSGCEVLICVLIATFGYNQTVAVICTAAFMAFMSAGSNVTVSMVTTVFGRYDFENVYPVISVPFKIIESFGVTIISLAATLVSYRASYYVCALCLCLSFVMICMTTSHTIASKIHED